MNRRSFFSRMAAAAAGIVLASSVEVMGFSEKVYKISIPIEKVREMMLHQMMNQWENKNRESGADFLCEDHHLARHFLFEDGVCKERPTQGIFSAHPKPYVQIIA